MYPPGAPELTLIFIEVLVTHLCGPLFVFRLFFYHWRLQITIDVFRLPLGIFKLFFLVWHILLALHFEFSSICSINRLWVSIILFIIIKKNLSKVNLSLWYLLTTCLGPLVYVPSKILKLFSFSVFLLWVYLMQVIPETHSCTLI